MRLFLAFGSQMRLVVQVPILVSLFYEISSPAVHRISKPSRPNLSGVLSSRYQNVLWVSWLTGDTFKLCDKSHNLGESHPPKLNMFYFKSCLWSTAVCASVSEDFFKKDHVDNKVLLPTLYAFRKFWSVWCGLIAILGAVDAFCCPVLSCPKSVKGIDDLFRTPKSFFCFVCFHFNSSKLTL